MNARVQLAALIDDPPGRLPAGAARGIIFDFRGRRSTFSGKERLLYAGYVKGAFYVKGAINQPSG
jgi:hypothetical protein